MKEMIKNIENLPEATQKEIKDDIENRILVKVREEFEDRPEGFKNYIEGEIDKHIAAKHNMLDGSQMPGAMMFNISLIYVFNKECIRALRALEKELLGGTENQNINSEPQREHPKQQQKSHKPIRGKGRPKETLRDRMICEDADKMLSKLHQLMNDRKGKEAALIITACIKDGIMTRPTFKQVSDEFGDIGNQSGYNKNMREKPFTEMEVDAIIKTIRG